MPTVTDDLAALVAELRAHTEYLDWPNAKDDARMRVKVGLLRRLLSALETAQRERDEARGVVNARWPDTAELDEKLADHDAWVRRQRMMRVAIAPVNVEAVGDLLREMRTMFAAGTEDNAIREARIAELEREVAALRECEDKGAAHD